jgi:hypothetical protein
MVINWQKENNIDFNTIDKMLGFSVHEDLKEFYTKNTFVDSDYEYMIDKKYLSKSINMGDWFEDSDKIWVELHGNVPIETFEKAVIANFDQNSIYGVFDQKYEIRYMLGYLEDDRGQIGLYFNNDTGEVDWCDFEYGADPWEANPRGIICRSIREFIDLLEYNNSDDE